MPDPTRSSSLRPTFLRAAALPAPRPRSPRPEAARPEAMRDTPRAEVVRDTPRTEAVRDTPRTEAVRRALTTRGRALAADLVFLEAWEQEAPRDIAATLRAGQIRRANRGLAAEISAELRRGRPLNEAERAALAEHAAGC